MRTLITVAPSIRTSCIVVAAGLTMAGNWPYFTEVRLGKAKPLVVSWLIWMGAMTVGVIQASRGGQIPGACYTAAGPGADEEVGNQETGPSAAERYNGGRLPKFTLGQPGEIKKDRQVEVGRARPAAFDLVSVEAGRVFGRGEGVVDRISHEGLRVLVRWEGVAFQRIKARETSKDPDYAVKQAQVEHLYAITDRKVKPEGRAGSDLPRTRVRAVQPCSPRRVVDGADVA
jgi:hypothetical protein